MISYASALVILILVGFIFGYLLGSCVFSIIIGKLFFKKDPRDFFSKNAGATNSKRIFGTKVAAVILVLDVLKCYVPTVVMWMIARYVLSDALVTSWTFNPQALVFFTTLGGLIGHCYPLYFKFNGGKAASSMIALMLAISPWITIITIIIWVTIIAVSKYVSLSSIISGFVIFILTFIPGVNWIYMLNIDLNQVLLVNQFNLYSVLLVSAICLLAAIILLMRHKTNITRLVHHEERKICSNNK